MNYVCVCVFVHIINVNIVYNLYALINLFVVVVVAVSAFVESKCNLLRIAQNCTLYKHTHKNTHTHTHTQAHIQLYKSTLNWPPHKHRRRRRQRRQRRRRRIAVETVPGRVSLAVYALAVYVCCVCVCATRAQKCVKVFWIIFCAALTFTYRSSNASSDVSSNSSSATYLPALLLVHFKAFDLCVCVCVCCCCNRHRSLL